MRAEDLFEAMGDLDEELIARSERRIKRHSGKRKRHVRAEIYRFAAVVISTAAAVFLLLMARDLIGTRSTQSTRSSQLLSREQEAESDRAEEAAAMADEAMETEETPAANERAEAEENTEAGGALKADEALEADEAKEDDAAQNYDEAEGPGAAKEADAGTESVSSSEAEERTVDNVPKDSAKAAVDLMGEYKGDYVSLEYISAEDAANGLDTTVPEYTQEGEEILSRAFENGKPVPSMVANTGDPTYFVYLTKLSGKVDTITFYELSYVSMTNYPGVVMKISQADYEDVMTLFR